MQLPKTKLERPHETHCLAMQACHEGRWRTPWYVPTQETVVYRDAIGRALEALRMIDRYKVMSGQQYEGFKALPSRASVGEDERWAREIIAHWSRVPAHFTHNGELSAAIKAARSNAHPDKGGSAEAFTAVTRAAQLLTGASQ